LWERMTRGVGRRPAVADLHGVLYAVVPDKGWTQLREVLATGEPLVAAGAAVDLTDLPLSRSQADETLALLRTGLVGMRLAGYEEVWSSLVLHRVAAASNASGVAELGPLAGLKEMDLDTLYQWLRHPGDPREASRALRIHPNTFRYRMKKIGEVVDLEDPDVRLALLVQLVTLKWA
jgi:sugar diacid utilization regulator